jgi:hypothetical protein
MKQMFVEHGPVFAVWYGATYLGTVGTAWAGLELAQVEPHGLLRRVGADKLVDIDRWPREWVNFAIALVVTDLIEPVRLPLVMATTPFLSRALRQRGWRK